MLLGFLTALNTPKSSFSRSHRHRTIGFSVSALITGFLISTAAFAQQATLTTLYSFSGADGSYPYAGLVQGSDGNFYGVTNRGGTNNYGTIFMLTPGGELTTLHAFSGPDGAVPFAALVQGSDGNFYGTAYEGGGQNNCGTVFKITPSGAFTELYLFSGPDGSRPYSGLIQASDGNFYGTTATGGAYGYYGTAFKLTPSGQLTTLISFGDLTAGANPEAGLVQGSDGNFYGTTFGDGISDNGTVFQLTLSGGSATLYSFLSISGSDGANPVASLVQGGDGNFYGTTIGGGLFGYGTVFRITPSGALTTLHSFNGTDGAGPDGSLVQGSDGNFYGTTVGGAVNNHGTVFQLTSSGGLTTLYSFNNEGINPHGSLVQGTDGSFYGTTSSGGYYSVGTVYKINIGLPAAPAGLTATATRNGGIKLSWAASSGATSYNVYQDTSTGNESPVPVITGLTRPKVTIKNLSSGTTYFFKVAAVNSNGAGPLSNEASATVK